MKKLRVLVLVHDDLVPPESKEGYSEREVANWATEYDVVQGLKELGHDVRIVGVRSDLGVIRAAFEEYQPHVAFNLLVAFHDVAVYDMHVVSYLELLKKPYTGCNPRGLMLARDKGCPNKSSPRTASAARSFVCFRRGGARESPSRSSTRWSSRA